MPRYGFRTAGFAGWAVERAAGELARLGYDCIELCLEPDDVRPERLDEPRCREIRRALDDLGVALASVSYHGNRDPYPERRLNQTRAVRIAGWLGAELLVLNCEKALDRPRQWVEHLAHLRDLCDLAEAVGVTIALEPEPLLVVGSSQEMAELLDQVGSPRLRVNLDVGHAQVTDPDPAESIRALGPAIAHLHLEDIAGRVHKHLPLGEGDIDFAAIRRALADIGYDGPYVADLSALGDDPAAAAARALGGLRERFG